jgi:hypothetical protein
MPSSKIEKEVRGFLRRLNYIALIHIPVNNNM